MTTTRPTAGHPLPLAGLALCALLAGCKAPDLRPDMPDFLKRDAPAPAAVAAPQPAVDPSLTPRELLTARLVNARRADDAMPGMTVGKLIEFADRYLACDCAGTRFARSWQRVDDGYRLATNAGQVRPLQFACTGPQDALECYLREIDRGPQPDGLGARFMAGGDFVRFIYEHGAKCERVEPCPAAPATAGTPSAP
jgi:hypothetical protein